MRKRYFCRQIRLILGSIFGIFASLFAPVFRNFFVNNKKQVCRPSWRQHPCHLPVYFHLCGRFLCFLLRHSRSAFRFSALFLHGRYLHQLVICFRANAGLRVLTPLYTVECIVVYLESAMFAFHFCINREDLDQVSASGTSALFQRRCLISSLTCCHHKKNPLRSASDNPTVKIIIRKPKGGYVAHATFILIRSNQRPG